MSAHSSPAVALVGQIVCRIIVPGWIITGAGLKLIQIDPAMLPGKTVAPLVAMIPIEPAYVLAAIVGIELALAAIMITLSTVARPTAIGVLGLYCLVAFAEMVQGTTLGSGCFGASSLTPVTMLAINAGLLLAACAFDPSAFLPVTAPNLPRAAAVTLVVAAFFLSFKVVMDEQETRAATEARAKAPDTSGESGAATQLNLASPTAGQRVAAPIKD